MSCFPHPLDNDTRTFLFDILLFTHLLKLLLLILLQLLLSLIFTTKGGTTMNILYQFKHPSKPKRLRGKYFSYLNTCLIFYFCLHTRVGLTFARERSSTASILRSLDGVLKRHAAIQQRLHALLTRTRSSLPDDVSRDKPTWKFFDTIHSKPTRSSLYRYLVVEPI